jgi:hypothetical protein
MATITTNKSMRQERPIKAMRRTPVALGETDDRNRVPGASGTKSRSARRRPGRAASLATSAQRLRSQRWRSVASGKLKRSAEPAKKTRGGRK